ncbi:hypothetical protein Q8A67_019814 [Cirrhinus molitorella]|uniref:Uncharacterized protein n=1 Tax=Cirrhinus molitorella TaxID=172907 RepID=A0AA88PBE5_9TELE|nr:hypothetical protein Q8A67_019814 [Cirrhinus molitorella]
MPDLPTLSSRRVRTAGVVKEIRMSEAAHRSVYFRRCALRRSAGPCSAASSSEELLLYVFCMLVRLDSQNTAAFLLSGSVEGISQDSWHACPCLHALLCSDVPDLPVGAMGMTGGGSGAWNESWP